MVMPIKGSTANSTRVANCLWLGPWSHSARGYKSTRFHSYPTGVHFPALQGKPAQGHCIPGECLRSLLLLFFGINPSQQTTQ